MKNRRYKYITLIASLLLCAGTLFAKSISTWAITDYNGDGVIDRDEKMRYMQETWGVNSFDELKDLWSDPNYIEAHSENGGGNETSQATTQPEKHVHSYTATVTKEPTCTEAGEMTYKCSCGDTYTEVIAMKPHDYESNVTKEPTCTETGIQTQVCKNCGDTIETVIPALGHKPGDWVTEKEPTCSEEGKNVRYCTVCGEPVETMIVDKLPHTEGEWEITQKPTLTKTGLKVIKCTECGEILQEEELPANTTLLYILIGAGIAVVIGVIVGVMVYKRRR